MKKFFKTRYDVRRIDFGIGECGWAVIRKRWYQKHWYYCEWDVMKDDYLPMIYDSYDEAYNAMQRFRG